MRARPRLTQLSAKKETPFMLQKLLGICRALTRKHARRPAARRVSSRPRLELLEDRCVPSAAGTLDPTFGNGAGYVLTAPTNGASLEGGELLQPDGKIIETGNALVIGKKGKISSSDF